MKPANSSQKRDNSPGFHLTDFVSKVRIFTGVVFSSRQYPHIPKFCSSRRPYMIVSKFALLLFIAIVLTSCGGNPYLDASLKPAEMEGKQQSWFEEQWGKPSAKSKRFFGGETWTYFRIAGGKSSAPFWNFAPNECQISLDFDKEGKLEDSSYSGC